MGLGIWETHMVFRHRLQTAVRLWASFSSGHRFFFGFCLTLSYLSCGKSAGLAQGGRRLPWGVVATYWHPPFPACPSLRHGWGVSGRAHPACPPSGGRAGPGRGGGGGLPRMTLFRVPFPHLTSSAGRSGLLWPYTLLPPLSAAPGPSEHSRCQTQRGAWVGAGGGFMHPEVLGQEQEYRSWGPTEAQVRGGVWRG